MGIIGLQGEVTTLQGIPVAQLTLDDIQLIETVPGEITPILSDRAKGYLYLVGRAMGFEDICFIRGNGGAMTLLHHFTNFRVKTKGRPEEFNRRFKEGFIKRVNKALNEHLIPAH